MKSREFLLSLLFLFVGLNLLRAEKYSIAGSDTVKASSKIKSSYYTSDFSSYSETRIIKMIDSLLELNNVPDELVVQLNKYISRKKEQKGYPAGNFYSSWDQKNTFLLNEEKITETDFLLILQGDYRKYKHPVSGTVTSDFGWRDSSQHKGIDIDLNKGDHVKAAFDGVVRIASRQGNYGNAIIIRHYNGLETLYGHLSRIKVKPGDQVKAGQVIGLGGSTGRSTGTHLHFETRFKGVAINPKYLISFTEEKLVSDKIVLLKTKWGFAVTPVGSYVHTVQKGDSISELAKRYGLTASQIRNLNSLPSRKKLVVGQKLKVS